MVIGRPKTSSCQLKLFACKSIAVLFWQSSCVGTLSDTHLEGGSLDHRTLRSIDWSHLGLCKYTIGLRAWSWMDPWYEFQCSVLFDFVNSIVVNSYYVTLGQGSQPFFLWELLLLSLLYLSELRITPLPFNMIPAENSRSDQGLGHYSVCQFVSVCWWLEG